MTAPDHAELREALARTLRNQTYFGRTVPSVAERQADALIAGPLASLFTRLAKAEGERNHFNDKLGELVAAARRHLRTTRLAMDAASGWKARAKAARAELDALKADVARKDAEIARLERIEDRQEMALHRIAQWADAYPLDIFPMPDWKKARALLEAGGMTLDSVSAANMRRVVEGVGGIARAALKPQGDDHGQ